MSAQRLWSQAASLLGIWAGVGALRIVANMLVALHSERMAHRNRLMVMSRFFGHVLNLPLSFHGDTHSGRLIKVMIVGLGRDVRALAQLLPRPTRHLHRRRRAAAAHAAAQLAARPHADRAGRRVLGHHGLGDQHTEAGQRQVETLNSSLAGTAQDALANVMVVQSFTRLRRGDPPLRRHRQQVIETSSRC